MSTSRYHAVFTASYLYWCEDGGDAYCPRPVRKSMDLFDVPVGVGDLRVIGAHDVQRAVELDGSIEPMGIELCADADVGVITAPSVRFLAGPDLKDHLMLTLFQGDRIIAQTGRYTLTASRGDTVLWTRERSSSREEIRAGTRFSRDERVRLVLDLDDVVFFRIKSIEDTGSVGAVMIMAFLDTLASIPPDEFRRCGGEMQATP